MVSTEQPSSRRLDLIMTRAPIIEFPTEAVRMNWIHIWGRAAEAKECVTTDARWLEATSNARRLCERVLGPSGASNKRLFRSRPGRPELKTLMGVKQHVCNANPGTLNAR